MPALLEVQQAIRRSVLRGVDGAATAYVIAGDFSSAERLNICRNSITSKLTMALRLSYPVTHKLAGAAFFERAAMDFGGERPPTSPYLDEHGDAFSDFLEQFTPHGFLGYLPDVARLEWAVSRALNGPDAKTLDIGRLALLEAKDSNRFRLIPHPSVRLVHCNYPADIIWQGVLSKHDNSLTHIDLEMGSVWLIVHCKNNTAQVARMSEQEWHFAVDLFGVQSSQLRPDIHAGSKELKYFANHLAAGHFTDFELYDGALTKVVNHASNSSSGM